MIIIHILKARSGYWLGDGYLQVTESPDCNHHNIHVRENGDLN